MDLARSQLAHYIHDYLRNGGEARANPQLLADPGTDDATKESWRRAIWNEATRRIYYRSSHNLEDERRFVFHPSLKGWKLEVTEGTHSRTQHSSKPSTATPPQRPLRRKIRATDNRVPTNIQPRSSIDNSGSVSSLIPREEPPAYATISDILPQNAAARTG